MAVKHDAIIPYLEIGKIRFNAWSPDTVGIPDTIDFTITTHEEGSDKIIDMYDKRHKLSELIKTIQDNPVAKVFGLETKLSEAEVKELDEKKSELLDYLQNLDKHYRWPNA